MTNSTNECDYPDWTVGEAAANVDVVIVQNGKEVTATFRGTPDKVYALSRLGTFTGTVNGSVASLIGHASGDTTKGNCSFRVGASSTCN